MKYWIGVFIFYLVLGQAFALIKDYNEPEYTRTSSDAELETLIDQQLDPEFGNNLWCED